MQTAGTAASSWSFISRKRLLCLHSRNTAHLLHSKIKQIGPFESKQEHTNLEMTHKTKNESDLKQETQTSLQKL